MYSDLILLVLLLLLTMPQLFTENKEYSASNKLGTKWNFFYKHGSQNNPYMVITFVCVGSLNYGLKSEGYPLFWTKNDKICGFRVRVLTAAFTQWLYAYGG